ncbi:PX domain-containing protein [Aphelenchoides avenae]|nr:PX domain-containing protein [Aphelenchus avenae]
MSNSTLLPDETYCRTELGAILYRDRKTYGFHAECVDAREPTSMFGHVEYDIDITISPHDALSFEPRHFQLTSRFKDLHRLYTQLSTIHRQLYLKDTVPNFAEAKLFGTTAPETIAERRRAITNFMSFVVKNEVLCKARVFQNFIEIAKEKGSGLSPSDSTASAEDALDKPAKSDASADDSRPADIGTDAEKASPAEEAKPEVDETGGK